jgi:hypothetical protein
MADIRIKENIKVATNIIEKIERITFINCDRIDNSNKLSDNISIIGQELYHIFPSIVSIKSGFIPNIYKSVLHYDINDTVFITFNNTNNILKNNEYIMLHIRIDANTSLPYTTHALNVTESSFEVKKWREYTPDCNLILYGTVVENYYTYDQTKMGIIAAAGVKELHQIVKSQQQTIDSLLAWATSQGYQPPSSPS